MQLHLLELALAVSVVGLVASHRAEWSVGNRIFKPIASTCMVGLGALAWDGSSTYGRGVLAALVAFWVSDMLLIPQGRKAWFLGGMAAAFAGHALYIRTFLAQPGVLAPAAVALVILIPGIAAVWRWLEPHLQGRMRRLVPVYAVTFASMASLAVGTTWVTGELLVGVGAVVFMISDLAVARHRFVKAEWTNKLWGLPMYYAGQAMLALSVASVGQV